MKEKPAVEVRLDKWLWAARCNAPYRPQTLHGQPRGFYKNGQPIAIYPVQPQKQGFLSWRPPSLRQGLRRR